MNHLTSFLKVSHIKYKINVSHFIVVIFLYYSDLYSQVAWVKTYYDREGGIQGLDYPVTCVVTPDDKNVLVLAENANLGNPASIVNFKRNLYSGDLQYIQTINDGEGNVTGISYPTSMAISKDGKFIYVCSETGAVTLFSFLNNSDTIYFLKNLIKEDSIQNLYGASSIDISMDNKSLYIIAEYMNALLAFSRNINTGDIELIGEYVNGQNGVSGLWGADGVKISSDNKNVYTIAWLDDAISVFSRDTLSGLLTFKQTLNNWQPVVDCLQLPTGLAVSSDGNNVYVTSTFDAIAIFSRNLPDGSLLYDTCVYGIQMGGTIAGLNGASSINVSNDNKMVYVTSEHDGLAVFDRNDTTGRLNFRQAIFDDSSGIQYLGKALSLAISNDVHNIYVCAQNDDAIVVFKDDTVSNLLQLVQEITDNYGGIDGIERANRTAFSTNNEYLYVASDYALSAFTRNDTTGKIKFFQSIKKFDTQTPIYLARDIIVSPDNKNVYAIGEFYIFCFSRNIGNGILTPMQKIYYNQTNGCLQYSDIVMSKNGRLVYVAANCGNEGGIVCLLRDTVTGLLSYNYAIIDNINGINGLDGVFSIGMCADDRFLYATAYWDHSITQFSVDQQTGLLDMLNIIKGSNFENQGLNYACFLTVSPDNKTIYVASNSGGSGSVVTLSKDILTGKMSIKQVIGGNYSGNMKLRDPGSISIAPDELSVYVTSLFFGSLVVFKRDTISGLLQHLNTIDYASDSIDGFNFPGSINIDKSNRDLYITSSVDNAVVHFKVVLYLGDTIEACAGDTISLSPNKLFTDYSWSTASGNSFVNISETGTYTLTVTDDLGLNEEADVFIRFIKPEFEIGQDTILFYGTSMVISPDKLFNSYLWMDSSNNSNYYVENLSNLDDTLLVTLKVTNFNGCTGIDSVHIIFIPHIRFSDDMLVIYPNPAQNNINIYTPENWNSSVLNIYSAKGQLLIHKAEFKNNSIDISYLKKGIYFIKNEFDERIFINKIILE